MKKITAFLTCAALSITMFAWSTQEYSNPTHSTEPEKIYITADHLHFHNNDIFVLHNDAWIQFSAVNSDEKGLFIVSKQRSPDTWYCSVCRTYHNADDKCPQKDSKNR